MFRFEVLLFSFQGSGVWDMRYLGRACVFSVMENIGLPLSYLIRLLYYRKNGLMFCDSEINRAVVKFAGQKRDGLRSEPCSACFGCRGDASESSVAQGGVSCLLYSCAEQEDSK
jgi:hypothetical protein